MGGNLSFNVSPPNDGREGFFVENMDTSTTAYLNGIDVKAAGTDSLFFSVAFASTPVFLSTLNIEFQVLYYGEIINKHGHVQTARLSSALVPEP